MPPTSTRELSIDRLLLGLICLSATTVAVLFVYFWQPYFNSDYAMIGLIAKRILTTGRFPIFIPNAGYQGLLLEGSAVALGFKLFGISARTLNLAPAVFFAPLLYSFYLFNRDWFPKRQALLTTLLIIIATPALYERILRTQPNYSECFTLGFFSLHLYALALRDQRKSLRIHGILFALGVLLGFGMYTYGQTVFFLLTMGAHLSLPYFYGRFEKYKGVARLTPWGGPLAKLFSILLICFFGISIAALVFVPKESRLNPAAWLALATALFVIGHLVASWSRLVTKWKNAALVAPGFLVGFSPKIYDHLVEHGRSAAKFGVNGKLPHFLDRLKWVCQITSHYFGATETGYLIAVPSLTLILFSVFFFSKSEIRRPSPHLILPVFVLGLFCFSSEAIDLPSARYTILILFFFSTALSYTLCKIFSGDGPKIRLATSAFAAVFFLTSLHSFYRLFADAPALGQSWSEVASWIEQRGVSRGYAGYWQAYAITYLTNEKIELEPVMTAYLPYYEKDVGMAKRIAYVSDSERAIRPTAGGDTLTIRGENFKVEEKTVIHGMETYILERL